MEYITEILGVDIVRGQWQQSDKLPYFLLNDYIFEVVSIGEIQCLLLKPIGELGTINAIKKHVKRLREICDWPVVFELPVITRQRAKSFIEAKIAFVAPGKQIYLPFIGAYLKNRFDLETAITPALEKFQPSAQMLLFAFITGKNKPMYLSDMANRFGYSAMTISRAANQLTQTGLVKKNNDGVRKMLVSDISPQDLYGKAKPFLINPVRKTVYISRSETTPEMFHAGQSALAERSLLNPPVPEVWGTVQPEELFSNASKRLIDTEKQCTLELWKYDPRLICGNGEVDALSLAVSLKAVAEERVEEILNETLREVW